MKGSPNEKHGELVTEVEFRPGRDQEFGWSLSLRWSDDDGELRRLVLDERETGLALARWLSGCLAEGVRAVERGASYSGRYSEPWHPRPRT